MEGKWVQRFIDRWTLGTVWIFLSLLWALSSLFIITWLPATIAVTAAMRRIDEGYLAVAMEFFRNLIDRAFSGVLLGIPMLLIGSLSWINIQIMVHSKHVFLAVLYIGFLGFFNVVLAGVIIQSIAALSIKKLRIRTILSIAWRAFIQSSVKTLIITCLIIGVLVTSTKIPVVGILTDGSLIGWLILKTES